LSSGSEKWMNSICGRFSTKYCVASSTTFLQK